MGKMHKDLLTHYKECVTENKWLTPSDARVMLSHIDAIEAEKDKLIENVVQLKKEHNELLENYEEGVKYSNKLQNKLLHGRESEKIALPKEVAAEFDYFKFNYPPGGWKYALLNSIFSGRTSAENIKLLSVDDTLAALVNGYTVEEPPTTEDKIRKSLTAALNDMKVECPVPVERLAKVLTLAVREVLAEDKQHELG